MKDAKGESLIVQAEADALDGRSVPVPGIRPNDHLPWVPACVR